MKKLATVLFVLISAGITMVHAQKEITMEDLWKKYSFSARGVPGFNFMADGRHYTRLENNSINVYDIETGDQTSTLFKGEEAKSDEFSGAFNGYSFSPDEQKLLIETDRKQIYRRSYTANHFILDRNNNNLVKLSEAGGERDAHFSPDGSKVAYVYENDIYYKDLTSGKTVRVTSDGKKNAIINGAADWVYEEELSLSRCFEWSPDGKSIAFIRFDESGVNEFTMTLHHDEVYPHYETFKYPKVGEDNAKVSAHIYRLGAKKTVKADIGSEDDIYIPRIKWMSTKNKLVVFKLNRFQNELKLYEVSPHTGRSSIMFEETNKYYINIHDNLHFLKDQDAFIWTSEQDGYNHIYLYRLNGRLKKQLTKGNFDVTSFYGVDEKRKKVYFQAASKDAMNREIFSVGFKGGKMMPIEDEDGFNSARFSNTFDYYIHTYSSINTPPVYRVKDASGKTLRLLEDNQALRDRMDEFGYQPAEFTTVDNREGDKLNAYIFKPKDYDPNKEYPLFMFLYGGPGSQMVRNSWVGGNVGWFQMLLQKGYMVACVDNRGTGARGEEFRKMTYMKLGELETKDQIDAAKAFGERSYIDKNRIGIFGWSYGGYMSSNCILRGNDVFSLAIAVAPVTNWKWYDSIYTERYMRRLVDNEEGYKAYSPVYFADQLKGKYMIVHGSADDNVHPQNAMEMVAALIKAGKDFEMMLYPNRNHGIYGDNARYHLYQKMTNFILNNL